MSSIIGARDREFGVARIKYEMLENSRKFREAPSFFVVDEQIVLTREGNRERKRGYQKKPLRIWSILLLLPRIKSIWGIKSK